MWCWTAVGPMWRWTAVSPTWRWTAVGPLRAIKDWVHGFWGSIVANFGLTLWKVKCKCLLLLCVAPPLMFTFDVISGHPHKVFSCTKPLRRGHITTIILIWGLFASKISRLFLHHNTLFQLIQLFIHGNSRYILPKCWNWQICHTHQALKLPLCTLRGKLQTFPTVKSKTIGFLLDRTQQYTPVHFGKSPCELLPEKVQLSDHYMWLISR